MITTVSPEVTVSVVNMSEHSNMSEQYGEQKEENVRFEIKGEKLEKVEKREKVTSTDPPMTKAKFDTVLSTTFPTVPNLSTQSENSLDKVPVVRRTPSWNIPTRWPHYYPSNYPTTTTTRKPRLSELEWLYCPLNPIKVTPSISTVPLTNTDKVEATFSSLLEENSSLSSNVSSTMLICIGLLIGK